MAENSEPAKRARKPNFTAAECTLLLTVAEENINIIKSKFTNAITNKNKNKVWEEITDQVNSLGVCKRSVTEIKEKWRGMFSSAKRVHSKIATDRQKTGGGSKPISPKGETIKIIDLFGEDPSFSGIIGGIESGAEPITIAVDPIVMSTFADSLPKQLEVTEDVLSEKSNSGEPLESQR
ncbi:t-SNARE domain-containing protein 1 [Acropora cervicornis]|uniref:t-SNARE domain-containing protein 1 n=1 Tax=Acropora cervicornis TaxID=6130 RepID=A0AAD9UVC0_ACRCE|nr:t-SNARE domain-containing protein 1 [Acropora cervicornis]